MSFESLLLLAFLLVVPLLERLIREVRARRPQPAEPTQVPPSRPAGSRPAGPRPEVPESSPSALGPPEPPALPEDYVAPPPASPPVLPPFADPRASAPPLAARYQAAAHVISRGRERARARRDGHGGAAGPTLFPRSSRRARLRVSRRDIGADLRRAMVLTAILGPCKAVEGERGRG